MWTREETPAHLNKPMSTQLNGQSCRIKFYPGLGFAPVIDAKA
jgi:hypothetical protein